MLREAILKPLLVGKKLFVRSGGVSLVTSSIMCNGSLGRHGNSLGIQIFLTYLTKSEANALVPDKFKWRPLEFRCSPVILGCEIIFQLFWLANVLRMLLTRCLAFGLKAGSSVLGSKFEIVTFVLEDSASMKFPRSTFLSDQIRSTLKTFGPIISTLSKLTLV